MNGANKGLISSRHRELLQTDKKKVQTLMEKAKYRRRKFTEHM